MTFELEFELELEYQHQMEVEAKAEYLANNPVARNIVYRSFTSKSKGIRNGKKRIRRRWKEVHLVKYSNGFHLWEKFPFDVYASEIIGKHADGEQLKEAIIELWGY